MNAGKKLFAAVFYFAPLACLCALIACPASAQDAKPEATPKQAEAKAEAYTCVIIDARGLGVERGMAPKIRRPDGSELWGTKDADPDYVLDEGIVAYCKSEETARKNKRCGDHPLILKAVKAQAKIMAYDVCVSALDGQTLLDSDKRCRFLDANHVIFLVDN